jgi:hypothetical protein
MKNTPFFKPIVRLFVSVEGEATEGATAEGTPAPAAEEAKQD